MSTYEYTDADGAELTVNDSPGVDGIYVGIFEGGPVNGVILPQADAPALALAVLEAAGYSDGEMEDPDRAPESDAVWHLRKALKHRAAQAEREAEDAKVREWVKAVYPGTPMSDTGPVSAYSRQKFHQNREFFTREEKPEPRVLQYGDPAPRPGTRWAGQIRADLPWYYNDRKRWTRMPDAPGCDWGDIGPVHFPMTEVTE